MIRNIFVIIILIGAVTQGYANAANCKAKNYMKYEDWISCTKKCQGEAAELQEAARQFAYGLRVVSDENNEPQRLKENKNIGIMKDRYKWVKSWRRDMTRTIKAYRKCIKTIQLPDAVR